MGPLSSLIALLFQASSGPNWTSPASIVPHSGSHNVALDQAGRPAGVHPLHTLHTRTTRTNKIIFRKKLPSETENKTNKSQRRTPSRPSKVEDFPTHTNINESVALNGHGHSYRFVFGLPNTDHILGLPTGQCTALRATINGQRVSRPYTLILNNTDLDRIELFAQAVSAGPDDEAPLVNADW